MVQRSVEFISGPPRDRIVMLPPHMDKSKSQPQHAISAELPLPRKRQHFQAYGSGDSQEIALANHLSATLYHSIYMTRKRIFTSLNHH